MSLGKTIRILHSLQRIDVPREDRRKLRFAPQYGHSMDNVLLPIFSAFTRTRVGLVDCMGVSTGSLQRGHFQTFPGSMPSSGMSQLSHENLILPSSILVVGGVASGSELGVSARLDLDSRCQ